MLVTPEEAKKKWCPMSATSEAPRHYSCLVEGCMWWVDPCEIGGVWGYCGLIANAYTIVPKNVSSQG